jgi:CDP-glucose 4,6-dehydratase
VIDSYKDPHYNFETNVMGTVNFFEAVRHTTSVKVAVNITTDKCYQNNEWLWGYRENDPMGGDDPYSASKGCSELITNSYIKSFFLKEEAIAVASARAGNVIGGGDWAQNRILPDLIRSYACGQSVELRNPNSIRPWQFVLEPLSGYLQLAKLMWEDGNTHNGGWNFGPLPNSTYSVGNVAEEVKRILPNLSISYQDARNQFHEAGLLRLDITKASTLLHWNPRLNFNETIQFAVKGYLDELANTNDLYSCRVQQIIDYCAKDPIP